jgi:hypothetical protein
MKNKLSQVMAINTIGDGKMVLAIGEIRYLLGTRFARLATKKTH